VVGRGVSAEKSRRSAFPTRHGSLRPQHAPRQPLGLQNVSHRHRWNAPKSVAAFRFVMRLLSCKSSTDFQLRWAPPRPSSLEMPSFMSPSPHMAYTLFVVINNSKPGRLRKVRWSAQASVRDRPSYPRCWPLPPLSQRPLWSFPRPQKVGGHSVNWPGPTLLPTLAETFDVLGAETASLCGSAGFTRVQLLSRPSNAALGKYSQHRPGVPNRPAQTGSRLGQADLSGSQNAKS